MDESDRTAHLAMSGPELQTHLFHEHYVPQLAREATAQSEDAVQRLHAYRHELLDHASESVSEER